MKLGLGAAEKESIMTPDAPGAVGPEQKGASGSAAPCGFVRATHLAPAGSIHLGGEWPHQVHGHASGFPRGGRSRAAVRAPHGPG